MTKTPYRETKDKWEKYFENIINHQKAKGNSANAYAFAFGYAFDIIITTHCALIEEHDSYAKEYLDKKLK